MNITEKDLNRWRTLANVITGGDKMFADDILSIFLEKYLLRHTSTPLNDDFVFISLKNTFLNETEKAKNRSKYEEMIGSTSYSNEIDDESELVNRNDFENSNFKRYKTVLEISKDLDSFDAKLFQKHFIEGISQRAISRETGITLTTIHNKIKAIKIYINTKYNNDYAR